MGSIMSTFKTGLGLLLLVVCAMSGLSPVYADAPRKPILSPDRKVRTLVRNISVRQVAFIQFSDLLHGGEAISPYDPLGGPVAHPAFLPVVTDPRLIRRFLDALRHASETTGPHPLLAWPTLEIHFRPSGGRPRPPVSVEFNAEYFGPQFFAVLNTLPGHLASRLHREVRSAAPTVREVQFAGIKVTDAAEVARLVRAMERVDRRAFDFSASPYEDTFEVKLLGGGSRSVDVVFAAPARRGTGKPPLPPILWKYYQRVRQAERAKRG